MGTDFATTTACLAIGLLPPANSMATAFYASGMLAALAVMLILPLLLYRWRRPAWSSHTETE